MEAFFSSLLIVFLAEMGDKTQLLALTLASQFGRPWAVMAGITLATLANHWLAAFAGDFLARLFSPQALAWIVGVSFVLFAAWILIPDKADSAKASPRWGPMLTTAMLFFLAEMGDKTQLATVAMAAKYQSIAWVVAGTTAGMLLSDGLAVWLGDRLSRLLPMSTIRYTAAGLFLLFGILTIAAPYFIKR